MSCTITATCVACGNQFEFEAVTSHRLTCSDKCRKQRDRFTDGQRRRLRQQRQRKLGAALRDGKVFATTDREMGR